MGSEMCIRDRCFRTFGTPKIHRDGVDLTFSSASGMSVVGVVVDGQECPSYVLVLTDRNDANDKR